MAGRVTNAEVQALVDTDRTTDIFIDTANVLVNEHLSSAGHSDQLLKQIELYLAAHFTAVTEERGSLLSSRTLDAKEEYMVDVGKGLLGTRYGQQAVMLDSSGVLSNIAQGKQKAQFRVV